MAGAVAFSALMLLALLAREARADLVVPEAASPPPVLTPKPVSSAPAPAAQPEPPAGGSEPSLEPTVVQESGQWTLPPKQRNPFDTDRPDVNDANYPSQLPLPSDEACDRACLETWSHYMYEEQAAFVHAVWVNGGWETENDEVRSREITDAIDEVTKRLEDLDKAKTPEPPPAPEPDPLEINDGPLSGSPDTPAGDTEAGDGDSVGPTDSDSGPSAEPSDQSIASGGGGGLRDEDDPFLLLD